MRPVPARNHSLCPPSSAHATHATCASREQRRGRRSPREAWQRQPRGAQQRRQRHCARQRRGGGGGGEGRKGGRGSAAAAGSACGRHRQQVRGGDAARTPEGGWGQAPAASTPDAKPQKKQAVRAASSPISSTTLCPARVCMMSAHALARARRVCLPLRPPQRPLRWRSPAAQGQMAGARGGGGAGRRGGSRRKGTGARTGRGNGRRSSSSPWWTPRCVRARSFAQSSRARACVHTCTRMHTRTN